MQIAVVVETVGMAAEPLHERITERTRVELFLTREGYDCITLDRQTNQGKTIIEKFENYAQKAFCAVCLLTGSEDDPKIRGNVLFETGYFAGKIGRNRIILISDTEEDIPSDLSGMVWVNINNYEYQLIKELEGIGMPQKEKK